MGYKNPVYDLLTAWYNLLDGAISVPVYKEQAPAEVSGNYVLLRAESHTQQRNKGLFLSTVVVIVEVVTEFAVAINTATCNEINSEITELLFPTPASHSISLPNHQVQTITLQNSTYLAEDADKKYYTKISRYEHLINQ